MGISLLVNVGPTLPRLSMILRIQEQTTEIKQEGEADDSTGS